MFFHKQFEGFNPVSGYVPDHPFSYLPEIAYRARALLQYRRPEQITAIAKRINSEIEDYFSDLKYVAISELKEKLDPRDEEFERFFDWDGSSKIDNGRWIFKDGMEDELDIQTAENSSEVDALKSIIEKRDSCFFLPEGAPKPEPDEYQEGKDYELFAVLSLWLLADAIDWPIKSANSLSIQGEYAIKAMDSVCYAEHLREAEWIVSHTKKKASAEFTEALRKQKTEWHESVQHQLKQDKEKATKEKSAKSKALNKIRHEKNYAAKSMVIDEWKKEPSAFPSAEKAGLHFADWLEAKGMKYEPRTVTTWIRDYAKQIGLRLR
jgi:hypothetical protein